ncbi:hypothetical protein ABH935_007405 [Catenulispora sp. GAS73]
MPAMISLVGYNLTEAGQGLCRSQRGRVPV